jgi:trk system potassium uptake protein
VDALFVSVSATSVTGLSSVEYPVTFTTFGSVVVMLLIQVGGIGIMTFTTLGALLVGRRGALGTCSPLARSLVTWTRHATP